MAFVAVALRAMMIAVLASACAPARQPTRQAPHVEQPAPVAAQPHSLPASNLEQITTALAGGFIDRSTALRILGDPPRGVLVAWSDSRESGETNFLRMPRCAAFPFDDSIAGRSDAADYLRCNDELTRCESRGGSEPHVYWLEPVGEGRWFWAATPTLDDPSEAQRPDRAMRDRVCSLHDAIMLRELAPSDRVLDVHWLEEDGGPQFRVLCGERAQSAVSSALAHLARVQSFACTSWYCWPAPIGANYEQYVIADRVDGRAKIVATVDFDHERLQYGDIDPADTLRPYLERARHIDCPPR